MDLIKKVGKSLLGLDDLKFIIASDKNKRIKDFENTLNSIKFAEIGKNV